MDLFCYGLIMINWWEFWDNKNFFLVFLFLGICFVVGMLVMIGLLLFIFRIEIFIVVVLFWGVCLWFFVCMVSEYEILVFLLNGILFLIVLVCELIINVFVFLEIILYDNFLLDLVLVFEE